MRKFRPWGVVRDSLPGENQKGGGEAGQERGDLVKKGSLQVKFHPSGSRGVGGCSEVQILCRVGFILAQGKGAGLSTSHQARLGYRLWTEGLEGTTHSRGFNLCGK